MRSRDAVARPVRLERQAEERLVEMDMAVDEAGDEERAGEVDGRRPGMVPRARAISAIVPVLDGEVDAASIGEKRVGDDVRPLKAVSLKE